MEHEKCYVFKPHEERPAKRRRVTALSENPSWQLRNQTCRELWAVQQQQRIDEVLTDVNRTTLDGIIDFVSGTPASKDQGSKIPTGLVVVGPSIASHAQFFDSLAKRTTQEANSVFVTLTSGDCPNLKTLLKTLIRKGTSAEDLDGDELVSTRRKGPKLLNYDLQLLHEWCKEQEPTHVVVAIQDSEAFEGSLLAEAIQLFQSWLDRIPFLLLFGIATSTEGFEEKLPGAAIRCLQGEKFDVVQADQVLEQVFHTVVSGEQSLWMGAGLSSRLLDRQKDHIQSVEAFVDAFKYAYMCHFYANSLSIFLRKDLSYEQMSSDDLEALRNLDSFRRLAEDLVDKGETMTVRDLLESDEVLFQYTVKETREFQSKIRDLIDAVELIGILKGCVPKSSIVSFSSLYVRAVSGELQGSPLVRELLLSVKKSPSDVLSKILSCLNDSALCTKVQALQRDLDELLSTAEHPEQPLRSKHDVHNETLRTTIVAQKVELSKQKSKLSKKDTAYSKIVEQLHSTLDEYFKKTLIQPKDYFLHEIVLYDLKSPHVDVFTPRPRFAVERALSAPHDYLNCSCCATSKGNGAAGGSLASSQPPVAILYQLYLESGSLINVNDLWLAFNAIINEDDEDEEMAMALFQRSLAEMKYLGLIKSSRKKTDHVAKVAWKGL
ncbi:uncharacterized protein K452DRAFT_314852 [Aplosporella prunicola CBS 121167]|uniref:Uncharacterized protein n=1 Tax=Aplosporella prunicola CBS 121167 TaxID=1176127 RepID=A0A6A6BT91_9PEZI|nr:uncharacterized protein K452DRAFT_314852 [Aplosporella prunicola CBS 121167]KAF2146603.1 hypothetical protein K452DRAFT_314852 [Aplosporella prunicola CBS 121167]